jgi:hypothetical protein
MGTLLDGLYDHEGYAARRLPDGTLTGSWTAATAEFTAYVAACSCAVGDCSYRDWYGTTEHPATDAGEQAAVDEWERVHARPLLARRRVDDEAAAARHAEALRTAGLVDPYTGGPNVEAIIGTWWHRDGPHDPDRVAAAALAVDELTHYLARATQGSMSGPRLYRLVGELRSAVARLDQVFMQMSGHAAALADDPTMYDDRGRGHDPAATAREAQGGLDAALIPLGEVNAALGQAHRASGHLGHNT